MGEKERSTGDSVRFFVISLFSKQARIVYCLHVKPEVICVIYECPFFSSHAVMSFPACLSLSVTHILCLVRNDCCEYLALKKKYSSLIWELIFAKR